MSAQELLLTALNQRYENYLVERKRCKDEFSEEAVHDLRVSARRLLALIEFLRAGTPTPNLKKLRCALKDQLDSLDDLRDTQVMLVEISETLESLQELVPLQKSLQKRERRLLKSTESDVRAFKVNSIVRRLESVRVSLLEPADDQELTAQLLGTVDDANLTVRQRMSRVDPAKPATIHHVRVAFKKFRYMLEIIFPVLTDFPEAHLKDMHTYQTAMGEIQDVEVFLRTLHDFAAKHPDYDPQLVRHFYEQRHIELINAYIENMNEYFTFWRESPEKPFPWQPKIKELA